MISTPLIKNVEFNLLEVKKDQSSELIELSNYVYNSMTSEIKSLKEKNISYEKRIKELEEVVNELKNRINNMESKNEHSNLNITKTHNNNNLFLSKIDIDEQLVKVWLNNRRFKATL